MTAEAKRPLKVFLCHASGDKPQVRALYKRLLAEGVDAWLDQEKLLPGQDWNAEITRAVKQTEVVVICLSNKSITKEGYVQREIRTALDSADEKPEGTIFLIPARLEDCVVPDRLSGRHWVDLFEEDGFVRLLRSLKLRAAQVGAVVEPAGDESEEAEIQHRLDQLYTEGLAAFYTEDWDRAYQRFQMILREQPNYRNALEKLDESKLQRDLAILYKQATDSYQAGNWPVAIQGLSELLKAKPDYKDASQLLKIAGQQKQLNDLYREAKQLHAAGKWQAVVRIFDRIHAVDPHHSDPDGLLPSSQKELAEIQRLAELNDMYTKGIREMDSGKWYEARSLLERVHKAQTGYLETERLLRKVESEITKIEERNKRNDQINLLYEQAHGLVRSKNWRKASEKIEQIRTLDSQFDDKDGLAEKINTALALEEQEAQKQNQLAAMYADAVRLLKEEKYQEALDRWHAVRAIDLNYPDRQWVQRTAKRKLDELSRPEALDQPWLKRIGNWFRFETNAATNREILAEKLLLLSVIVVAIIHKAWVFVFWSWLNVWDWESISVHLRRFVVASFLGGLYGTVVSFALTKTIYNWHRKHSLTVIIGFALAIALQWLIGTVFDISGFFDSNLLSILFLFSGLSTAVAIKWAKPATSPISMIIILVGWAIAWISGETLAAHLSSVFNADFYPAGNALTILLGLLFTLGTQFERSRGILETAFFGAFGFAVGNYVAYITDTMLSFPAELSFAVWGLIGGAILEAPSRNRRRIAISAGVCGAALLAGSLINREVLPQFRYANLTFQDRNNVIWQMIWGAGIGLALGLLIRRPTAIGVMVILGAGIFMVTRATNAEISGLAEIGKNVLRGGLIGLVLGYGYGYMSNANLSQSRLLITKSNQIWAGVIALLAIAIPLMGWLLSPAPATSYRWDFDNGAEGWGLDLYNAISTPRSTNGHLIFKSTGNDPNISSPHPITIYASITPVITIRMRTMQGQDSDWAIYFLTDQDNVGSESKTVLFSITNDGTFGTYNILMSENPAWQDIITEIRLDPPDSDRNVQVEIDYISVHAP